MDSGYLYYIILYGLLLVVSDDNNNINNNIVIKSLSYACRGVSEGSAFSAFV